MSHDILHKPLSEMNLTYHLKEAVEAARFNTLNEVLEYDAHFLVEKKAFSLHAITELITLLQVYGLERMLKE
jgi:hypothetical protein